MRQVSKKFCVVAYDISDDKRRKKVIKTIEKYGRRINYSVFECLFTDTQLRKVQQQVSMIIDHYEDSVIFYPLCLDCFSKAVYFPDRMKGIAGRTPVVVLH